MAVHGSQVVLEKRRQTVVHRAAIKVAQARGLLSVMSIDGSDPDSLYFSHRTRMCLANISTTNNAYLGHGMVTALVPAATLAVQQECLPLNSVF